MTAGPADAADATVAYESVRQRVVVERHMRRHGTTLERRARRIKSTGPALVLVTAGPLLFGYLGWWSVLPILALATLPVVWHERRLARVRRRMASGRLCLGCAYSLHNAPTDAEGWGRCPECGRRFHASTHELDRWAPGQRAKGLADGS